MASVSGALQGVSGAANAVIGTMSLLGVENDELQKKLNDSVTALIGITQGLGSIDPAVKSFRELKIWVSAATSSFSTLKKVLVSTGIGALVVAVGTLVAYKDDILSMLDGSTKGLNNIKDANDKLTTRIEQIQKSKEGNIVNYWEAAKKAIDEYYASQRNLTEEAKKQLTAEKIQAQNQADWYEQKRKTAQEEYNKILKRMDSGIADSREIKRARELAGKISEYTKFIDSQNAIVKEASATLLQLNNIEEEVTETNKDLSSSTKEVTSIFQQFINEAKTSSKEIEDFELSKAFNFLKNLGLTDEEIKRLGDRLGNDVLKVIKYMRDTYGERFEKELQITEKLDIKVTVPKVAKPEDADTSKLLENTAKAAKKYDDDQLLRQEKIKKNYNEINKTLYAQGQLFAVLEDVFAENEEASKAMAIASIISDTAAAIMGTWAGYSEMGPWGTVAAAIQTAAIATTGALQIANVKNQNISAGNAPTVPEVKTSAVQQSNYQGGDYRVYVTETDITNTQNRVKVIESGAKY